MAQVYRIIQEEGAKMQAILLRILNVTVTILSYFFVSMLAIYSTLLAIVLLNDFFGSLTPNTVSSTTFTIFTMDIPMWPKVTVFLILLGSMVYYFKSNEPRMRLISSAGCISMIFYIVIINILFRLV